MNLSEVLIDEANMDIVGAQNCMCLGDIEPLKTAVAGLLTLRNICTKMNLLKLEVMIQIRIDDISVNTQPEVIFK